MWVIVENIIKLRYQFIKSEAGLKPYRNLRWHSCQVKFLKVFFSLFTPLLTSLSNFFVNTGKFLLITLFPACLSCRRKSCRKKLSVESNHKSRNCPKGGSIPVETIQSFMGVTCFSTANASDTWIPYGDFNATLLAHEKAHLRGRVSPLFVSPSH